MKFKKSGKDRIFCAEIRQLIFDKFPEFELGSFSIHQKLPAFCETFTKPAHSSVSLASVRMPQKFQINNDKNIENIPIRLVTNTVFGPS